MKNVIIKDDVYNMLTQIKGKKSFSELIGNLVQEYTENRRKNIRSAFAILKDAEFREMAKIVEEVKRGAKGRLF